ncbi:MAG: trypsin-like serine protease [Aestuariivirga sp.]|uniref:trypsin-like serine protease n=1 Tax=Aestuariivirga sp. TaxID=2650926 RepID=UPI0038CF4458
MAPGASLQQLSGSNPELAAALSAAQAEVSKDGQARVAVKTAVAFAPETLLGDWERTVQRREIASAAAALRKAMPKAKNFTARLDMPYVLLTVDQAGLAKLQTVPGLVKIVPEEAFNWRRDFVRLRSAVRTKAGTAPSSKAEARRISPRIVGGTDASPGVHPFQVGLMNKRVADNFQSQFCGGTLVSEYHVVTAAHCVDFIGVPRSQVQVLVGTQSLARRGGGNRINVSRIVIHPGWNPETSEYDAAVLELATPVTGIAFATLATMEPTTPGTLLRVTGWGWLSLSGDSPSNLQQVDVPFVPTVSGACGSQEDVTPRMICAGGEAGKDSCKGDSGGPLTINRGSGFTELVGIVSFGEDCALPGYPGVYTNVAETSINGFIRGIVDAPRAFQFEVSAYEVNEAARRVTVRVTRAFTAGTATVMVAAVPGTAAARSDFRAISRKMTFRPGVTSVSVPITIVNDRAAEGPETFTVSLSSPSGGLTLGSPTAATVTIIDND